MSEVSPIACVISDIYAVDGYIVTAIIQGFSDRCVFSCVCNCGVNTNDCEHIDIFKAWAKANLKIEISRDDCSAKTYEYYYNKDTAIKAWNIRAYETEIETLKARIKELVKVSLD